MASMSERKMGMELERKKDMRLELMLVLVSAHPKDKAWGHTKGMASVHVKESVWVHARDLVSARPMASSMGQALMLVST
jgi:hypothetical protein